MINAVFTQGDTYPPLRGQAFDDSGVVDLSVAQSIQIRLKAKVQAADVTILGTAVADTPPVADPNGINSWNWHYNWKTTDTATVGLYDAELKVTWLSTAVQTFGGAQLQVLLPKTF